MTEEFLPADYTVPEAPSSYMKFAQGDNRFRILGKPIMGNEYWVNEDGSVRTDKNKKGKGTPVRLRMTDTVPAEATTTAKHFWALPVFHYGSDNVQVLELTQKGIMRDLTAYGRDKDWGSPVNYDIVVHRTGEGLDTEYSTMPKPAKPLPKEIVELWKNVLAQGFDLERMFSNGNPFSDQATPQPALAAPTNTTEEIDLSDIPFN